MSQQLNTHDDHIASCLCCRNLLIEDSTPEYSEYTPGEAAHIKCTRDVFPVKWCPDEGDFHSLQVIGQTCHKFEGKP